MSTRLETALLVIRTFEPGDGEAWLAMLADPEVRRYLPGPAPTTETFQSAIEGRHAMEREGGYAMWAVGEKRRAPSSASAVCARLTACSPRPGPLRRRVAPPDGSSIWPITSPRPAGTRATRPRPRSPCLPTGSDRSAWTALLP